MKHQHRGNRRSPVVWAQYIAFRIVVAIVRCLPLSAARALGRMLIGRLGFLVLKRARQRAIDHARMALDLSEAEGERLIRRLFLHLGNLSAEFLLMPRIVRRGLDRLIRFDDPSQRQRLEALDKAAVFVTPHLGNWEVLGATTVLMGIRLNTIARPLDNPLISDFVFAERKRFGQGLISKRHAWGEITRMLGEGNHLSFLPDQDARRHGIFVDFLGRPASTTRAPALAALQHGASIIPGCAVRDGDHYRIFVADPIVPNREAPDRAAEVKRITQEYTRVLEGWIRQYPEQWMWMHRRWKTTPDSVKPRRRKEAGLDAVDEPPTPAETEPSSTPTLDESEPSSTPTLDESEPRTATRREDG